VWKIYTWNCKEHVIYSLCGKVISGTVKNICYMFFTVPGIDFPHKLYITYSLQVPGITFPHKLYITCSLQFQGNIQLVWKSYIWNCKEHLKYSLCGNVIPGTVKNI
jgi:hypothetical protein